MKQLNNYNFFYLCFNPFFDIKPAHIKHFYSIKSNLSSIKNSAQLLSLKSSQKFITQTCKKNNLPAVIVPFKPHPKIEKICQKNNWILASNSRKLNLFFEDKLNFQKIIKQNNLPTIPNQSDYLNSITFKKYQRQFGNKLVIQTRHGWAGKSTFVFDSFSKAQQKIGKDAIVKFSPFLIGHTLTNNAVVVGRHLIYSPPALQYNGFPPFSDNPFTTIGRQWPSLTSKKIQSQITKITKKFAKILKKHHYQGFFGLDFFLHQNKVYLLECNPRLTASFNFYTKIEEKNKITPLFYYHLTSFLNTKTSKPSPRHKNTNLTGSQLTYKNKHGDTTKIIQKFTPFITSLDKNIEQKLLTIHEKNH